MAERNEHASREMVTQVREEVKQREKAIMQRLMTEERELFLEEHPEDKGNGFYERSLITSRGLIEDLRVPRTRSGEFYPAILPGKRRASVDLGDLILIMFQCGINTRRIQQVIEAIYGTLYSHSSIAKLARVAEAEIEAWRMRPLKQAYFSVVIDAVFLSLRRGTYEKEPVYIAQGTDHEGRREILGFFLMGGEGESAHAWREIFGELKERGVERIDIVVSDDLSGIEEASRSVFPSCDHQLCCVHAVRNARTRVRRSDCSDVLSGLKTIYRADDQKKAERALASFAETWKKRYPSLVRYWRENFSHLTAFMKYPEQVRPYIYTTNQLERINKEIKRRCKTIEAFSSEESLVSVLYLILKFENEKLQQRRLRGFNNLVSEEEG
ncbi:MAG: IS256 family transposase [Actinobacteria bacterium]|nr:IS256 family transposase [Actinomycetota bacterium]